MKIIVIGTSEFTMRCAEAIIDCGEDLAVMITMPAHKLPLNSADIQGFARKKGIPCHEIEDLNAVDSLKALQGYDPDIIFSSWPRLLGREVLRMPRRCVIGTHPTDLPFNRGRHPLHWLIAQGVSGTQLTFFKMDEGVDTGSILLKVPISIDPSDSISDLSRKVNAAAYRGSRILLQRFSETADYQGVGQDQAVANYWRKRTPHDVTIDFRMSTDLIRRTVLSFTSPYPCANLIFKQHVIKIKKAEAVGVGLSPAELERIEPGRILSIDGKLITMKTADGVIRLECIENPPDAIRASTYIHPPSRYFSVWAKELSTQLG